MEKCFSQIIAEFFVGEVWEGTTASSPPPKQGMPTTLHKWSGWDIYATHAPSPN